MVTQQAVEDIVAIISAVLIFLGLQSLLGNFINTYPYLFIIGGALLFAFRKKITEFKL